MEPLYYQHFKEFVDLAVAHQLFSDVSAAFLGQLELCLFAVDEYQLAEVPELLVQLVEALELLWDQVAAEMQETVLVAEAVVEPDEDLGKELAFEAFVGDFHV
jgi:hypothetical protein